MQIPPKYAKDVARKSMNNLRLIFSWIPASRIADPEEITPTEPEVREEPTEKNYKIESPESFAIVRLIKYHTLIFRC